MQQAFDTKRRLEDRFPAEGASAVVNGVTYKLQDWSVRGLALTGYKIAHERGERLRAIIKIPKSYGGGGFETGLFVVRGDPDIGLLAAVYVDYAREAAVTLDRLFPPDD